MREDTIVVLAIIALLALFVIVMMWPAIVKAEKVDVDTAALPTFVDEKGVIHLRGWVKNITTNETDTDFSVEMTFKNGQFLVFYLGKVSDPAKSILAPGQVMYWDYATTNKLYAGEYTNMKVRYNEIPYTDVVKIQK